MTVVQPPPHRPRVSLLMPNRDNAAVLDLVFDRLARHTTYPDVELVVVDDGSTDESRQILRRWRDAERFQGDFRLIEHNHTSDGVIGALNVGLRAATGELVVQLDADASIETPGWLEKMVAFFVSDARIGVVTARIVTDDGALQACGIEVIGPKGYYNRGCEVEPAGRGNSRRTITTFQEREWPLCERIAEVDGGQGTCMMYRRDVATEIGGYDRGFAPVWLDDLDLTISFRRSGFKVFYAPDVRVLHHLGRRDRPDDRPAVPGRARTAVSRARRVAGAALPVGVRRRIVQTLGWDRGPRQYRKWRESHYRYWRTKWGWDLLKPDLDAIHARWGETEICWKLNPEMRRAGEEIIAAFQATQKAESSMPTQSGEARSV
jgi:GT2 family glycosyltransferase